MSNDKVEMLDTLQSFVDQAKIDLGTPDRAGPLEEGLLKAIIRLDGIGGEFVDEVIESEELNAAIELSAASMAEVIDIFGPVGTITGILRGKELLNISSTTALYCFLLGTVYARGESSE